MKRVVLAGAAAALALVVACATSTRADRVNARADQLRDALASAVSDPARRAELLPFVDAMETTMVAALEQVARVDREFVAASSEPDATPIQLSNLAARIATVRRVGMQEALAARLEMRRKMSADEWAEFARALPAFDGGQP